MEQPSHQPPHPASHRLREPLLPLKHVLPPTVALREGGRLPWCGLLAPRSPTPFVTSSRTSLPFVSLQARLWTRCQLRTGTHPAVCGGTAWAQAPGGHGRAGLCTASNGADRTPRSQPGAGRGRRAARQAGGGAEGPPPAGLRMQTTVASSRNKPRPEDGPHPQRAIRARVLGFKAAAAGLPGGPSG